MLHMHVQPLAVQAGIHDCDRMNANARTTLINVTGILEVEHPTNAAAHLSISMWRHDTTCSYRAASTHLSQFAATVLPTRLPLGTCHPRLQGTFTSGEYTMRLSAKAYENWKFREQGLPHDLVARSAVFRACSQNESGPSQSKSMN